MSIRVKILLACLSLTAITISFGLLARAGQSQMGDLAFRLYDDAFMSMSYLRSAQNTMLAVSRDLTGPGETRGSLEEKLDSALGDLQVARDRALSPGGAQAAAWLQSRVGEIQTVVKAGGTIGRQDLAELESHFDDAVEINAGDGFRSRRATGKIVQKAQVQTWSVMAVSVAVALAITYLLSRAIVPAVRHAVGIATDIASGRLDMSIDVRGSGETAVLLRALAIMRRSISDKIARIEELMTAQASSHAVEIAEQHARFETALDNMVQGLCMLDGAGRVLVHNRRFGEMFALVGAGGDLSHALPEPLLPNRAPESGRAESGSYSHTLDDGRTIAVSERPMPAGGWVMTYEDVTERRRVEARMAHMARHDALTGLPNRVLYREQMDHALAQVRRGGGLAVLCLDLDHFKAVNDTLGHPVGDALLHAVAQRLLNETRETDTVVRLGGDEFAIIQASATQPNDSKALAERLVAALSQTFDLDDAHQISIGTSIGIAITTDGLTSADALLKSADLALYRAKADGRNTFRFFEAEMDARMQARRVLEIDLRRAVAENQFEVFYQPLVTAKTRQVSGFEALVRWRHPTRGMVSPAEFIPVAEETGLIARIGAIVLEQACLDALSWPDEVKVAVNLSPLQFRNRNLAGDVSAALVRSGLPAHRLELEITESLLLQDSDAILTILHAIRALGVRVSMDDFGTGYSSLSYLRRFPFDKIKIDQSFIRNLDESGDCLAIVRAVLGLGRSLGMSVVAEGVETEEQLMLLHREGCEQVQGYLFSKPQPIAAVQSVFKHHHSQVTECVQA